MWHVVPLIVIAVLAEAVRGMTNYSWSGDVAGKEHGGTERMIVLQLVVYCLLAGAAIAAGIVVFLRGRE